MIKLLLTAGMAAPSAFDERSTELVVVNDPKLLKEFAKVNPKSKQLAERKITGNRFDPARAHENRW